MYVIVITRLNRITYKESIREVCESCIHNEQLDYNATPFPLNQINSLSQNVLQEFEVFLPLYRSAYPFFLL
jgi:hypothetical protein